MNIWKLPGAWFEMVTFLIWTGFQEELLPGAIPMLTWGGQQVSQRQDLDSNPGKGQAMVWARVSVRG